MTEDQVSQRNDEDSFFSKSYEISNCKGFNVEFQENSDDATSKKSDSTGQKLRKLPKSQAIKKDGILNVKNMADNNKSYLKADKWCYKHVLSGRRRAHARKMALPRTQPNDITESSDPERSHFSNNVIQIMQRTKKLKDSETIRSFLDITSIWDL